MTTSWTRIYGPAETDECGDIEFEYGSTYGTGDERCSIIYFVEKYANGYGIHYRCESWRVGDESNSVVTFDWAEAKSFPTLADAEKRTRELGDNDESFLFSTIYSTK